MNCRDHPLEPFIFVCIAQQKCQRKLCASCQYLHEAHRNEILPNQLFLDQIQKKAQQSKLNWNFEQQCVSFKEFLSNSVIIFQKIIKEIFECINKIYQMINKKISFLMPQLKLEFKYQNYPMSSLIQWLIFCKMTDYLTGTNILNSWRKDETKKFIAKVNQVNFWEEKTQQYQGLEMVEGSLQKKRTLIYYK